MRLGSGDRAADRTEALREDTGYFEMITAVREALHAGNSGGLAGAATGGIATAGLGRAPVTVRGAETR
jgi:NitT/TauT family transport system ATP-binding protein